MWCDGMSLQMWFVCVFGWWIYVWWLAVITLSRLHAFKQIRKLQSLHWKTGTACQIVINSCQWLKLHPSPLLSALLSYKIVKEKIFTQNSLNKPQEKFSLISNSNIIHFSKHDHCIVNVKSMVINADSDLPAIWHWTHNSSNNIHNITFRFSSPLSCICYTILTNSTMCACIFGVGLVVNSIVREWQWKNLSNTNIFP